MDDIPNDTARRDAPSRDNERQPAPSLENSHFTMTVDEASARFSEAGLPRSIRSIQRYCQRGHLTCTTVDTEIAEMYLIDATSVERRIEELQQIEFVTRATGVSRQDAPSRDTSRQDAPSRDTSRHDATRRDEQRQEVSSEKIDTLERRVKELEYEKMQVELDKRAKEYVINQLTEDRKNLFEQIREHFHTITDQARTIGQLETRLELGPGRVVHEETPQKRYEVPSKPAAEPQRPYTPPVAEYRREPEPLSREYPQIEYPPRYSSYDPQGQGDNRPAGQPGPGVE